MTAIRLLACAGMITGVFILLDLKPVEFSDGLFAALLKPRRNIREELKASTHKKKPGILQRELREAQAVLEMTGREKHFSLVCAASLVLFCVGGAAAILIGNFFLARCLRQGFCSCPSGM